MRGLDYQHRNIGNSREIKSSILHLEIPDYHQCGSQTIPTNRTSPGKPNPVLAIRSLTKVQQLRSTFKYLNSLATDIPQFIRPYVGALYVAVLQPYADASEPRRICWKIVLLNSGIWFMWQLQRLQPMMSRAFVHNPLSGMSYTLLTSAFRFLILPSL